MTDTLGANALASNSITSAKIADDAITSAKVAVGVVTVADIADGSITSSKLSGEVAIGRRNIIHNGAMKVAQRGTITGHTSGGISCDRYRLVISGGAQVTTSQDTDVPDATNGFKNSLKIDCTTADTSVAAGDYAILYQRIEGQDLQHLLYGTSSAKQITVQFWVKSAKTGIHIVELFHLDATYFNAQQYTVSAANTWEKKTVTFVGYQTTAFDNDANGSLQIAWWLLGGATYGGGTHNSNTWHNTQANRAVGQVNVLDDTANNFYLTGVQVEVADAATDFEHRSFVEELATCQRYFIRVAAATNYSKFGVGRAWNAANTAHVVYLPVPMRGTPVFSHSTASNFGVAGVGNNITSFGLAERDTNNQMMTLNCVYATNSMSTGTIYQVEANGNTNCSMDFSADI